MIGKRYQGKGYGMEDLQETLKTKLCLMLKINILSLFYHVDNVNAKKLYSSFGFVKTGILVDKSMFSIKEID